jgi:lipoprotein signal peptidase
MTNNKSFLTIAPPVVVPTQLPLGALMFSAALQTEGFDSILLDASLDFFRFVLNDNIEPNDLSFKNRAHSKQPVWHTVQQPGFSAFLKRRANRAIEYFQTNRYFSPEQHRTHINNLHQYLSQWSRRFHGWQLGITDITFSQILPHEPEKYLAYLENGGATPFTEYIHSRLLPRIQAVGTRNIGVSVTYISQIYFTLELGIILKNAGYQPIVGGALINILDERLKSKFDFYRLFHRQHPLVPDELLNPNLSLQNPYYPQQWPKLMLKPDDYFTPVPVIPFLLSRGCYWNKCRFCPDHGIGYHPYETKSIVRFLENSYNQTSKNEIIFNIADSAIAGAPLNRILPFFQSTASQFYGFFRFENFLLKENYLQILHNAGARLLQFGLESGSPRLLELYQKGIDLKRAEMILHAAHQTGLKNYVYLLFGLPSEKEDDHELTLNFVRENAAIIDFLNIALFNLPVNCDLLDQPDKFDIIPSEEARYQKPLQFYTPFSGTQGYIRNQARRFIQQQFKRDPLIRPLILNTPARIRIDHAVFFTRFRNKKSRKKPSV